MVAPEKPQPIRDGGDKGPPRQIGVDLLDEEPQKSGMLPVWFFIGIILFIYGLMILAGGIIEFSHPHSTVLAELHPALWWGALLTIIGGVYVYFFFPRKS